MASELPAAVLGEEVFLRFESPKEEIDLSTLLKVTLIVSDFRDAGDEHWDKLNSFWDQGEMLKGEKIPEGQEGAGGYRIPWKVKIRAGSVEPPFEIEYLVSARSIRGTRLLIQPERKLRVVGIRPSKNPRMHRIMRHEFNAPDGSFEPAPLQKFIRDLTLAQRQLLARYPIKDPAGRLVVFVTFHAASNGRLMGADYSPRYVPTSFVRPNASFSVFWVRGPGKDVILVCHTEHFLVNMQNSLPADRNTNTWIAGLDQNRLDPNTDKPLRFVVAMMQPQANNGDDGLPWNCIFTPKGRNIMPKNGLHGQINTIGCWMLFRNFNWPRDQFEAFNWAYNNLVRPRPVWKRKRQSLLSQLAALRPPVEEALLSRDLPYLRDEWKTELQKHRGPLDTRERRQLATEYLADTVILHERGLAKLGYAVRKWTDSTAGSWEKWYDYDRNFAYTWFFRDVVGLSYFSRAWKYAAEFETDETLIWKAKIKHVYTNDFETSGRKLVPTFERKNAGKPPAGIPPHPDEQRGYLAHDTDVRKVEELGFTPDAGLLTTNALGFQSCTGFVPGLHDVSEAVLAAAGWADVYFYKEPGMKWPPINFLK